MKLLLKCHSQAYYISVIINKNSIWKGWHNSMMWEIIILPKARQD